MKVSIFTDASVNPHTKKSGYAFYIGCATGKIQKAGSFKEETTDINMAELRCIANALFTLKHSKFSPVTRVWIFTDSQQSANTLTNKSRGFSDEEKRKVVAEIHVLMAEVCLQHGGTIRTVNEFFTFQHVKAHTGKADTYSKINDWCDANAKKYTRTKIKKAA